MERIQFVNETIRVAAAFARPCNIGSAMAFIEGYTSMQVRFLSKIVPVAVVTAAVLANLPAGASAGWFSHPPLQVFDQMNGYAVPIEDVWQFPAAIVEQQGVVVPIAPPRPLYIRAGEHHVILR
jgi:hypothetical protein